MNDDGTMFSRAGQIEPWDEPAAPAAPPTSPTPEAPRQAAWPVVLGVVLIVFGGLGVLVSLWGAVANLFLSDFMASLNSADNPQGAAVWTAWAVPLGLLSLVHAAIAGLLLAAGIGMLRRRGWSIRAVRWWAWLRIAAVLVSLVINFPFQQAQLAAMSQQSAATGQGMPAGFMTAMVVVGMVVGLVWALALPVFVLVWLRMALVKREVERWGNG